jgi:hypothetical protein
MSLLPPGPNQPGPSRNKKPDMIIALLISVVVGMSAGIFAHGVGDKAIYGSVCAGFTAAAVALPLIWFVIEVLRGL